MLKAPKVEWQKCSDGSYPTNAFSTGAQDGGKRLFVARALHKGSLVPGKLHQGHTVCYVSWGGEEHGKNQYEVLLHQSGLTWVKVNGGQIPPSALEIGNENGVKLYSVKGKVQGVDALGKYHSKYKCGYFPYGGKEHTKTMNEFEILCAENFTTKTNTNQDLVRTDPPNVSASGGISVQCPVCMESLETIKRSGADILSTVCGHIFCSNCLPASLTSTGRCPSCRRRIGADDYHKIFI